MHKKKRNEMNNKFDTRRLIILMSLALILSIYTIIRYGLDYQLAVHWNLERAVNNRISSGWFAILSPLLLSAICLVLQYVKRVRLVAGSYDITIGLFAFILLSAEVMILLINSGATNFPVLAGVSIFGIALIISGNLLPKTYALPNKDAPYKFKKLFNWGVILMSFGFIALTIGVSQSDWLFRFLLILCGGFALWFTRR